MAHGETEDLIGTLVGSAHLFIIAVIGVKEKLLADTSGSQLTYPQLKVLKLLQSSDASNIGDVAAFLGVSNAAASKTVDRLVKRKYLRRMEARADRRATHLSLTEAGRKVVNQYDKVKDRQLAKMFQGYDPQDLSRTADLLERLTKSVVMHSARPEEICLQCGIYLQKRCFVREAARADCFYHSRKNRAGVRGHAAETETPARRRSRVGPPG
jgi:DNA-binding MarR family transcriptional regulator